MTVTNSTQLVARLSSTFGAMMSNVDDDDRQEWNRAWSSMPHHSVDSWSNGALSAIIGNDWPFDRLVKLTISADPAAFADKCYRRTSACPICGATTDLTTRLAASIHPVFDLGEPYGRRSPVMFGVWVHRACFESCPATDQPTPIPW